MMSKMLTFAGGIGLGMLGQKYGKDVIDYCKSMKQMTCKSMQNNKSN
ncbi:MAG: hypothetical protein IJB83_00615 [Bacilli bacterium]|nr:hypothetical protein [Bacilli bacterium]